MTRIEPKDFITADWNKFEKVDGDYFVKTINGFSLPLYDTIEAAYPTTSTETYTYKKNTETVAVITVTYTDDTKEVLTSVVKS